MWINVFPWSQFTKKWMQIPPWNFNHPSALSLSLSLSDPIKTSHIGMQKKEEQNKEWFSSISNPIRWDLMSWWKEFREEELGLGFPMRKLEISGSENVWSHIILWFNWLLGIPVLIGNEVEFNIKFKSHFYGQNANTVYLLINYRKVTINQVMLGPHFLSFYQYPIMPHIYDDKDFGKEKKVVNLKENYKICHWGWVYQLAIWWIL